MKVPYHNVEIEVPFDGVTGVEYFELKESLNTHSTAMIQFLVDEDKIESILMQSNGTAEIAIMEKGETGEGKMFFCGRAVRFSAQKIRGLCYLWTEFSSYTLDWDLTPKSQSFCSLSKPYSQVLTEVIAEYPQKDVKDEITNGMAIQDMLVQYEETDWEFLKRLSSHFSTFMVADGTVKYGRAYFGIPELSYGVTLNDGAYQMSRNQNEYDRICLSGQGYAGTEILPQELTRWNIRSRKRLHMAETLSFNGIDVVVTGLNIHTEKGELISEYELCRKSGILCSKKKNPRIYGMSIPATVKERSGNRIRVQMDIDRTYEPGEDQKYFTYAIESSSIYCMPEENSRVHIYFPSHDEADAIAVHAISKGGGAGKNPANKSFTTPAGMAMNMKEDEYSFHAGASSLTIGIDGAFKLIGKSIQFTTPAKFAVGEEIQPQSIQVEAETSLDFRIGDTTIAMTDEANIVSAFIAHNEEKKEVPGPSAECLESDLKANDAAIMSQINHEAEAYLGALGEKRSQAKAKVRHGVWDLVGTVLFVGVIAATGGIAAAPIAAIVTFTATNHIMADVAEIHQGATDWAKANRGDTSPTENMFQSALGLSDEQYQAFMTMNNFVFDVVTMSTAFVNISNMAFNGISGCTSKALAKGASMMAVSTGKSVIDQYAMTGKIDPKRLLVSGVTGFLAGGLGGMAGNGAVAGIRSLGVSVSNGGAIAIRAAAGGIVGGTADNLMRAALLGDELSWESLFQSAFLYVAGSAISDATTDILNSREPINVALGAFLAREIDMAIPDIREALLWERRYNSADSRTGILGKGWQVPFEGRLFREESGRLHVTVPGGALVLFEWEDGAYQESGKIKGRYGLNCDTDKMLWSLTDYHTHQVMQYDREGKLSGILDKNGRQTMLSYRNGQLEQMVTPLGHRLRFRFSGQKLAEVSDESGRTVTYHYDGELLKEVMNTDGGRFRYEYSEEGQLTKATDPTGLTYLVNQYDARGRVCSQVLWDGDSCRLAYHDSGNETAVSTKEGTTVYQYTREKMPLCITYPDGTDVRFRYNENHCCIYRKDRLGNEQFWDYDRYTRIIYEKKPNGLEVHYEYNTAGDLARVWDSSGKEMICLYDTGHQVIERRELREKDTEQWQVKTYAYDSMGRLIQKTSPSGKSISYSYKNGCGKPVCTEYEDGETVRREYDQMERMMVKEDSCGRTEYGYNSRDDISVIRDGEGNETKRLYDCVGRLLYLYPPRADRKTGEGATRYHYNFMRYLDDIIYPDGSHERTFVDWEGTVLKKIHPNSYDPDQDDGDGDTYEYDSNKKLIRIHHPDGGTERFFRDSAGNCVKHVLPEDYDAASDDGAGYRYAYDAENRLIQVVAPDGTEEQAYCYDLRGNLISVQTADGSVTYYWYDLLNQMIQKAEPAAKEQGEILYRRTCYLYDDDGNRIKECRYGGSWRLIQEGTDHRLELAETGQDLFLNFTYDARNRLVCAEDDQGACIRYRYDVRGNRIREEQKISDQVLRKISYRYDRGDRLVEKREVIDSGLSDGSKDGKLTAITLLKRDPNGNITEIVTPEGYRIMREYDIRDRLVCERIADEKNGIDRSTSITYDKAGNVLSVRRKGADTGEYAIHYSYDLKDRLIRAQDLEGAVFEYVYDRNDRLAKEIKPSAQGESSLSLYSYDSRGRLTEKKNTYGETVEKNQYDPMGRRVSQTLADGEALGFRYGIHGEVEDVSSERSRKENQSLQKYRYNSHGQIIGLVDGNGNETGYELDAWGNIRTMKAADGGKERYTYDYAGNITSATDANGGTITYRYNSQGNVCEIIDQDGNREQFHYDREGRRIRSADRLGNQLETEYNVDGNPVREISCDCEGRHREVRTWEYDSMGHLRKAVGGGFCYRYEYRPDGKLLRKTSGGRSILSCTYYPNGSLKTMTDITGKPLLYRYDQEGNLSCMADETGTEIVSYRHTAGGKLKEILHRSGVRTAYEYDTDGNILRLHTQTAGGVVLCDLRYEYDLNGNRTAKTGSMALPDESGTIRLQARSIRYTYDSMSRLFSETDDGREDRYRYDPCGNRQEKVSGCERETYHYNRKNQLIERENGTGIWRYGWDQQGNLRKESGPAGELRYEYNPRNQQTRVLSGGRCIQKNHYDGEGLRAGIIEHGKQSTFVFMNNEIIAELDASGILSNRYIRGHGAAALEYKGIQYGIHQDEQLSTGWLTGADGAVENACEYDAFGNLLRSHENVPNRLLYGGQQYDPEVRQYYLRARYYNPVVGRFTQEDPYRGDGLNLYAYCANNPVTYYDPSGYWCEFNQQAGENAQKENVTGSESGKTSVDDIIAIMKEGNRTADGKNIITQLDDNTKVIFRMDVGENAHSMDMYGYNNPVNHINIEIQVKGSSGNYKPKWNFHMILDDLGEVSDSFATGIWTKKKGQ